MESIDLFLFDDQAWSFIKRDYKGMNLKKQQQIIK